MLLRRSRLSAGLQFRLFTTSGAILSVVTICRPRWIIQLPTGPLSLDQFSWRERRRKGGWIGREVGCPTAIRVDSGHRAASRATSIYQPTKEALARLLNAGRPIANAFIESLAANFERSVCTRLDHGPRRTYSKNARIGERLDKAISTISSILLTDQRLIARPGPNPSESIRDPIQKRGGVPLDRYP